MLRTCSQAFNFVSYIIFCKNVYLPGEAWISRARPGLGSWLSPVDTSRSLGGLEGPAIKGHSNGVFVSVLSWFCLIKMIVIFPMVT